MSRFIDLTGQKFGRLEVLKQAGKDKWRNFRWLCKCNCGNKVIVSSGHLRNGSIKSCGCLVVKHGHCKNGKETVEYRSWKHMKHRCTNSNDKRWEDYGGRKIKVCKRWLNSFSNFLTDMGECPRGRSLDRKNNNKNYCKSNCRWAKPEQQQRNKRNNRYVPYKGESWLFIELCEKFHMPYNIVYLRYYQYGWTLEESLTIPVGKKRKIDISNR